MERNLISSIVLNMDDIKNIEIKDGVIAEIKMKRKGTYGHKSKDGPRYFSRKGQKFEYKDEQ